jgi:hypothetical protein
MGGTWDVDRYGMMRERPDVTGMMFPARCTRCPRVYDLAAVERVARYADCDVWKCPGCKITVDNRPPGWGDHHYVELNPDGSVKP